MNMMMMMMMMMRPKKKPSGSWVPFIAFLRILTVTVKKEAKFHSETPAI